MRGKLRLLHPLLVLLICRLHTLLVLLVGALHSLLVLLIVLRLLCLGGAVGLAIDQFQFVLDGREVVLPHRI